MLVFICRFSLIEAGPKLLYLNTTQRGYPKGLRAGSDPRKPLVAIDEHFETLDCRGISSPLQSIEVGVGWMCGRLWWPQRPQRQCGQASWHSVETRNKFVRKPNLDPSIHSQSALQWRLVPLGPNRFDCDSSRDRQRSLFDHHLSLTSMNHSNKFHLCLVHHQSVRKPNLDSPTERLTIHILIPGICCAIVAVVGMGLWRPAVPRRPAGHPQVADPRGGTAAHRQADRRRLAGPSRPVSAGAGRPSPVQQLQQVEEPAGSLRREGRKAAAAAVT